MINSRNVDDLHPKVRELCVRFIAECMADGIEIIITSTYRDNESQAALYAQGRTTPGKRVTKAQPGRSVHNYRLAFDFLPGRYGKFDYEDKALFTHCGQIAESVGLEWSGRWVDNPETAHCQFTGGLTIAQLFNGEILA